jgi:hypothetical protein
MNPGTRMKIIILNIVDMVWLFAMLIFAIECILAFIASSALYEADWNLKIIFFNVLLFAMFLLALYASNWLRKKIREDGQENEAETIAIQLFNLAGSIYLRLKRTD